MSNLRSTGVASCTDKRLQRHDKGGSHSFSDVTHEVGGLYNFYSYLCDRQIGPNPFWIHSYFKPRSSPKEISSCALQWNKTKQNTKPTWCLRAWPGLGPAWACTPHCQSPHQQRISVTVEGGYDTGPRQLMYGLNQSKKTDSWAGCRLEWLSRMLQEPHWARRAEKT